MSMLCALPLAASLFASCAVEAPLAVGYAEGENVLLTPIDTAQILSVNVRRGDRVAEGDMLAELESEDARLAVAEAEAALLQARAQLADLRQGKRPEEIAVLQATLQSARAQADEAQRALDRTRDLAGRGVVTQADLDRAQTALEQAQAAVGQAEANLAVGGLPAREETIKAAENQVTRAQAVLDQARWRLSKRRIAAPGPGEVQDIIRNAGDTAGPAAPVLSMLPDGAVKLKLYLPEPAFATVSVGDLLRVRCDGCADDLTARISYVSAEPEFTPPVIYSLETRQKLVHLVEARPEGEAPRLKPGQIVDVVLADRSDGERD